MKIYNTLSGKKEEFVPLDGKKVKIYSCGPTVYNFIHIGNARPLVIFDTVSRYLTYKEYDVIHIQNFTDIDDKIINKAIEEGVDASVISKRYIAEALKDERGLNIKPPYLRPKVTEEIQNIIEMIETLIQKNSAYEKNGTVYFNSKTFPNYGKLSKKNIDELEAGARVGVDNEKLNPSDFVLWKPAKEEEPFWASPWGNGRPGWHIECSAMIKRYLGDSIDIHTGGCDLIFPHHENEIAQSETVTNKPLAKYWMHNGFVNVDNKKMSKSEGNFFTLREIAAKYDYAVVRFFLVCAHYRMPINFSDELIQAAENSLTRIQNGVANVKRAIDFSDQMDMTEHERTLVTESKKYRAAFETAMDDDFNTADAVTAIFEFVKFTNINVSEQSSIRFAQRMMEGLTRLTDILGLNVVKKQDTTQSDLIEAKIEARQVARLDKDFAAADAIRDELSAMGVVLEDTPSGVRWAFNNKAGRIIT